MRIEITGRKYDVGTKLENLINAKIDKQIGRYFGEDDVARVVCKMENGKYKMELTIVVGGTILRAENTAEDMYTNIDVVVPKVERQMRKYRTKLNKNLRETIDMSEAVEEAKPASLVRTKHYKLSTLSVEDALFQMDMVDNSFYIFLNEATGLVSVVYKRRDGDVGMIEAEY